MSQFIKRGVLIVFIFGLLAGGVFMLEKVFSDVPQAHAAATSVYISQSGAGTQDGLSCTNAKPVTFFNSSGNWGAGASQIGPGTTVYLCGTITSGFTFQGDGTSGNYITVDGTGATYSNIFNTNNRSWWKIQNVTYADGTPDMITVVGGSNGVFTGNYADNTRGGVFIAQGNTLPNNITISNNFIRTATVDCGTSCQIDIVATEGSTNVFIEGNYLEMRAGGAGGGSQHDDVIQTWESGSSGTKGPPSNWTIRYNRIVMNSVSANDRSWTMLENLGGTVNIYGNVFLGLQGAGSANGLAGDSNQSAVVFNRPVP